MKYDVQDQYVKSLLRKIEQQRLSKITKGNH